MLTDTLLRAHKLLDRELQYLRRRFVERESVDLEMWTTSVKDHDQKGRLHNVFLIYQYVVFSRAIDLWM